MKLDITTKYFFEIITLLFISYSLVGIAYGQNIPPPSGTPPAPSGTPPAAVAPTVTNVPTPTAPNPNLQYLPQKAYVQSFAPEVGIPQNAAPLQAVSPVVAPSPYQQQSGDGFSQITNWIGMLAGLGGVAYGHIAKKKADSAQDTSQQNAQMNVQQAVVQQKTLEQVYENMQDKGVSITNKPEIQLAKVAEIKDKALETAAKA